ncbi:MAG TPA: class I tRNA ligase family protein, partial [Candidatus Paceibacterota bacterium]
PVLVTVGEDGKMKAPGKVWDGKFIKEADPLIVQDLKERGFLYKTELYEHDYPFCWRCETPLMYYAKNSWFFKTTAVKDKMLAENAKIDWHPSYLKDGRFGEWLKENVDWGISRERFWGAPLPVWRCEKCKNVKVVGSLKELDELDPAPTELVVMRHGQALHNVENLINPVSPENDRKNILTEKGRRDAAVAGEKLKKEKIEVIVSSPSWRAHETARIVGEIIGVREVETIPELYDIMTGEFEGKPISEFEKAFSNFEERFWKKPEGAENLRELRARAMKAIKDIREKYAGKKILLVSHGDTTWLIMAALAGMQEKDYPGVKYLEPAEFHKVRLHNRPYNSEGELDLHKPYVDAIELKCPDCSGKMRRVSEVIDVWFDSGAMPFAGKYYPNLYPADYISEAIDQTRGWFYTLLAVSSLLGLGSSYKRVLSLGLVLDEKGGKMSKSKGNVVDP